MDEMISTTLPQENNKMILSKNSWDVNFQKIDSKNWSHQIKIFRQET